MRRACLCDCHVTPTGKRLIEGIDVQDLVGALNACKKCKDQHVGICKCKCHVARGEAWSGVTVLEPVAAITACSQCKDAHAGVFHDEEPLPELKKPEPKTPKPRKPTYDPTESGEDGG